MYPRIWHVCAALYPSIYVISIPWYIFLHRFLDLISASLLIRFLNNYLVVKYGYLLFTIAYLSQVGVFKNNEVCVNQVTLIKILKRYSVYTIFTVIILAWFFGPLIYERINYLTGGYCDKGPAKVDYSDQYKCSRIAGANWVNGFDASGHVYILLTMCLLLWDAFLENINLRHFSHLFRGYTYFIGSGVQDDLDEASNLELGCKEYTIRTKYSSVIRLACLTLAIFLIVIWSVMYIVTCLFFHTLAEKLVLLIVGIAISLLIDSLFN